MKFAYDKGNWMAWSYWDIILGERRVYAKSLSGDSPAHLIHERQEGDGPLSTAHVDISDDGSLILFSFGSRIYVTDATGGNKVMVLEQIATSSGLWDLSLKSPPQFAPGNVPEELYFVQVAFGNTTNRSLAAGLWTAKTNLETNGEQIFNGKDVADLYGEDLTTYTPNDGIYGPVVSDNNEVLFGTRDYSASGYSDLWLYDEGEFLEITKEGPAGGAFSATSTQMDMSSDGSTICWMNGEDHSYNAINRFTGLSSKFKGLGLGNDDVSFNFTGAIRTNHDGSLFFLQGSSGASYNTALATYNGKVHYPLAISKYGSAPTHEVWYIEMKKETGDMIYYSSDVGNIWMSEFEKHIDQDFHPQISGLDIRHTLKGQYNGPPYNEMSVHAATAHPSAEKVNHVTFMELDDPLRPINHLNNAGSSELYDDGSTRGDQAVDGQFSSNYIWPTFEEHRSEVEDTITLRVLAWTDHYISSVDIYPYYILDQAITSPTIDPNLNAQVKVYPNVAENELWIDLKDQDIGELSQVFISDHLGRRLQQIPVGRNLQQAFKVDITNLESGMHYLSLVLKNGLITKKFIKLN